MNEANEPRRHFLVAATSLVAGAGVVGAAIPFIGSWNPSAKARALGAPIQIDITEIERGAMITVQWQGKPVWVLKRTSQNLDNLRKPSHRQQLRDPDSEVDQQPNYARNEYRSIRQDILVAVGLCTHLGCIPNYRPDGRAEVEHALYFCACHGSKFDLAGRVYKNVPASANLVIPPHQYIADNVLEIGTDATTG